MKNIIIKALLSVMMVSLSVPNKSMLDVKDYMQREIKKEKIEKNKGIVNELKDFRYIAFTKSNLNMREKPNIKSKILDIFPFNSRIQVIDYDEEWSVVICPSAENKELLMGYVNRKYISKKECKFYAYSISTNTGFKSYMSYGTITDSTSLQYMLQNNFAYTGRFGIRQVNNRYCVAVGTTFQAGIGTYFDLVLENNVSIPCIVADIKADKDTCIDNMTTAANGCVSEFVVNVDALDDKVKRDGDISSCCEDWDSPVKGIRIYEKNIFK